MARVVLWFKNDLRMHDNYVLNRAADLVAGGKASEVKVSTLNCLYKDLMTLIAILENRQNVSTSISKLGPVFASSHAVCLMSRTAAGIACILL